jgi:hypothetical protein
MVESDVQIMHQSPEPQTVTLIQIALNLKQETPETVRLPFFKAPGDGMRTNRARRSPSNPRDSFEEIRPSGEYPPVHQFKGGGTMRYLFAVLCPPLALLSSRRWFQAIPSSILYGLAIVWMESGFGALIDFFLILWAFRVVGERYAEVETQAFVRTVEPIPIIRS